MKSLAELSSVDSLTETSDDSILAGFPWDNSDPIFSAKTRDIVTQVFDCYVHQAIAYVGIPANFICCVVFLKP
ncbi:hypothetical protein ACOMHN_015683 [Nucella lapillus]